MNAYSIAITEELIQEIAHKAVEYFHPQKIILFGSRAWGSPQPDSDLDILIIMKSRLRPIARAVRVREVCRPKFVAMDVLVRTPGEIKERLKLKDPFFLDIFKRGRVLYEA
jgi:predicted nucleotidyltransferase